MERVRRGEIWTVSLPAFPKPRPALIVSIDPINDLRPDVLVVPITSKAGPLRIALPEDPQQTGLAAASFAKCESVGPVHKSLLKARIGKLSGDALPAVEAGLLRVLGLDKSAPRASSGRQ